MYKGNVSVPYCIVKYTGKVVHSVSTINVCFLFFCLSCMTCIAIHSSSFTTTSSLRLRYTRNTHHTHILSCHDEGPGHGSLNRAYADVITVPYWIWSIFTYYFSSSSKNFKTLEQPESEQKCGGQGAWGIDRKGSDKLQPSKSKDTFIIITIITYCIPSPPELTH